MLAVVLFDMSCEALQLCGADGLALNTLHGVLQLMWLIFKGVQRLASHRVPLWKAAVF